LTNFMEQFWTITGNSPYKTVEVAGEFARLKVNGVDHQQLFAKSPRLIVQKKGKGDVIIVGPPDHVFISDKLRVLLKEMNATGYDLLPADVKLTFPHKAEESVYWQLVVTGWGGVAPPESGVKEVLAEPGRAREFSFPTNTSKLIDPGQYDGSDFFRFWPYPADIVVSDRVKTLFDDERIKYCKFFPLSEIDESNRMSTVLKETTQALPLALYFPLDRAEQVGRHLGIDWYEFSW